MMQTLAAMTSEIRRFNRFYTRQIGVLNEGLLNTPFSLAEARLLYEVAHSRETTASHLAQELRVDPAYVSRMLRSFEKRGLIARRRSAADRRQAVISLTKKGKSKFFELDERQNQEVASMLTGIAPEQRPRIVGAMALVQEVLEPRANIHEPYLIRTHRPGDMGWIVHRHGALYSQEYGWDEHFEALVAQIVAEFIQNLDPKRERCWIAERYGQIVGSIFAMKKSESVCKLRLLYVEPSCRGLGIGKRLVDECIRFARQSGYENLTLWTQSNLSAARHIYESAGFALTSKEKHHSFGRDLVAETWDLKL